MLVTLLKGFIDGLGASIPLGPLGVLCVQKTINRGRNSGLITGLGASVSDTLYAAISILGLAFIQKFLDENFNMVMIVGGIIISFVGVKVFLTNPVKQISQKGGNKRHIEDFFEALIMTLTNPGALFLILGLLAAVGIDTNGINATSKLYVLLWGVFLGTATWWFVLTTSINKFRNKFRIKQLIMINRIAGIIIIVLGIITLFDGLLRFIL